MAGSAKQACDTCGSNMGFSRGDDGFFYCGYCNSQADDKFDIGVDDEQIFTLYNASSTRVRRPNIPVAEPVSQFPDQLTTSQYLDHPDILDRPNIDDAMDDGVGPTEPSDFASSQKTYTYEEYHTEIRSRYVMGIQLMIQIQAQALVEKFNVSPLIIGIVGPVWLRFLASTKIMADEWADRVFHDSEAQTQEKQLRSCSGACPIRVSRMFRPLQLISSQKLESMAADIAQKIGLKLPPVNFYAIASRYLRQLSLPTEILLPSACHIYEWSMPSELYLSANEGRIPTRACVMSILIIAIRILFDVNGYGMWESNLSRPSSPSSQDKNKDNESESHSNKVENVDDDSCSPTLKPSGTTEDTGLSVMELLQILNTKYYELADSHEYSCGLPTYLKYCKDVVFTGLKPSFEDIEEEKLIDELWTFYDQNNKGAGTPGENVRSSDDSNKRKDEVHSNGDRSSCSAKSKRDDSGNGDCCSHCSTDRHSCSHREQDTACSSRAPKASSLKEKMLRQLKLDMEENQFCYITPRVKVKRRAYLHYARKKKDVLKYAVHADYYILLRCCAKAALVETRVMHIAVLSLERRLKWLEKRVDHSLHFHPNVDSGGDFSDDDVQNTGIDYIG